MIPGPDKDMVPNFNAVLDVLERYYPAANFLVASGGFTGWEDMLQNLNYAFPKRSSEILEYEMRIGLGDCTPGWGRKIVAEKDVMK